MLLMLFYKIVKKNLKLGLFISTPLLFAFMVLVSSLSAIDYTSAQLVETAVNEKPDLIVKINNFSNYSVSNRFKADMLLNDKVEKATLFYYSFLNILTTNETDIYYQPIENFIGLNIYAFPEEQITDLGLSLEKGAFYSTEGLFENINQPINSSFDFNIYSIKPTYANLTNTT